MARDKTARSRIRQHLATHGPVEDASGHATSALQEAIDYLGSSVAFIQLVAAMDRDGEISREIRGKRTYRIELTEQASALVSSRGPAPIAATASTPVIDYDLLARAVVRELVAMMTPAVGEATEVPAQPAQAAGGPDDYARRLRAARQEIDALLSAAEHEAAGESALSGG